MNRNLVGIQCLKQSPESSLALILMALKHYLECSPRKRYGQPSTGARFTGPIPNLEQLQQSVLRRRHISSYIAFIRPEISHIIKEYGRVAIQNVCRELYAIGVRATPSPWFEMMCDRTTWKLCFDPLGDDAPEWPWAHINFPSVLAEGEQPESIYERYCQSRMAQDEETARMNAQLKAQADAAAAARAADPNSKFIVTSPAPIQNIGEPLRVDTDYDMRNAIWNLTLSKSFHECNVVGPFEVEPKVPLEWYVAKDLAAINELLPPCIAIKMNVTNKRVFVTIVESEGVNPAIPVRQILLDVWEGVRSWAAVVNGWEEGEMNTLLRHFLGVKQRGGLVWSDRDPLPIQHTKNESAHGSYFCILMNMTWFEALNNSEHWEIDILKIISCFFPTKKQKSTVNKIQWVFYDQHVARYVAKDSDDEDAGSKEENGIFKKLNSLGGLIDARAHIVQQLLPILDFDYRLVVFLARPIESDKVFKAKLQLAAILTVGVDRLFTFPHRGIMLHEDYRDSLIEACHGWTWPLAYTGSMWLDVGLWKHGATIVGDHSMADSNEVAIPRTSVTMNLDAFNSVQRALTALSSTLIPSFVAVLPDFLAKTEEMDDDECDEIQQHLA
ncbi:hypothetical protein F52700_4082 [Fusarium sp. NRRL 52700]|nr:hypothetical protein F52700_4082 [Fusarium sp. NRRL 52700]